MTTAPVRQLVKWLNELGCISEEDAVLTRTFLSPAMRQANVRVSRWMREAGLTVREDSLANIIGRLEAGAAGVASKTQSQSRGGLRMPASVRQKTLLLGSHLDTVRNAGRFDGALGVLLPIVALQELRRRGIVLPFAVEVVGFSEEEGVRFTSAYLGSKGYTGQLRARDLNRRDSDGVSVREALTRHNGGHFSKPRVQHRRSDLLGYLEVHLEQGPVLEAAKLAVGVVSGIVGQTRARVRFGGKAGHAGTTPMALRRDALAGAAEWMGFVEKYARDRSPLVATVGTLTVHPGAPNVIPADVVLSLDLRHPRDGVRADALRALAKSAAAIARRRGLSSEWQIAQDDGAVGCSVIFSDLLEASVRRVQERSIRLVSGAGHDAVVMAALSPIAMLFVRCRDGLSHHPDEFVSPADLAMALTVVIDFLERLAREYATITHASVREISRARSR